MTRVIVMDEEFHEPLTIVEISASWFRAIQDGHHPPYIRLPVEQREVTAASFAKAMMKDHAEYQELKTVWLRFEQVRKGTGRKRLDGSSETETIFWFAYADDPELALTLRAAFLPGQIGEVQRLQKAAYVKGVFDVLFR